MKTFQHKITDEVGIHARPAGLLVKKVKELNCAVSISKGDKTVDASKLMAIMQLGVKNGDTVTLTFESNDEQAYDSLKKFFEENL